MNITDEDREKAGQIAEATWADFMAAQNTPHYRPTPELWAAMACMALSGIACERHAQDATRKAAIEAEREACAKILDDEGEYYRMMAENSGPYESTSYHRTARKVAAHLARKIRARSEGEKS